MVRAMRTDDWDPDRMMGGSSGMYGGGLVMLLLVLLLVGLAAAVAVWAVRATQRDPQQAHPGATTVPTLLAGAASPRDLLDQRLARGEITPEEYGTTRRLLDS